MDSWRKETLNLKGGISSSGRMKLSRWKARLQIHPPEQVLEARVVAEGVKPWFTMRNKLLSRVG
jgi:hypothetical protein